MQAAIDSVLGQSYERKELLIIDGGSRDGTSGIIQRNDQGIAYTVSEKDNGIYHAMNKGIAAAKGDWIYFLGADDVLFTPTVLADIFLQNGLEHVDFLYGEVAYTNEKKQYLGGEKNYVQLVDANICHQAIFFRKEIFEKLGPYNTRYAIVSDHAKNIEIYRDESLKKNYLPTIIALFNNSGASSDTIDKHFHGDMLDIFLGKDRVSWFAPQLQQYHFYYGIVNLLAGKLPTAIKHIPASWLSGRRKIFYFFFTGKFVMRILSRRKIKLK